jgi:beta-glucuronidase
MPVPASYNDLTQDRRLRDHIGDVWYERTLWVPATWSGRRIVLRVGAAAHHATVYVNGREVARHKGGFLPFEADLTDIVRCGRPSRVTIAVNNVLDYTTLPPGWVKTFDDPRHPPGHRTQEYQFDFFNYAGLHRPVRLYATPRTYVEDITVVTDVRGRTGLVGYEVRVAHEQARAPRQAGVRVRLEDAAGRTVARGDGPKGRLKVPNARLWQPGKAYLYTLVAEAAGPDGRTLDVYRLPVGIRTVEVRGTKFLINRKPFYFKGFGKHEDMDIKGKGLDEALNSKDVALLKWIGANSFRTSHYPYSEEMMDLADREGLVVIDEAPAVGMNFRTPDGTFGPKVLGGQCLDHHLQVMRELVARDKNRPCVVMWSVANEPNTREDAAGEHFRQVIALVRRLDPTRPVTLVECLWPDSTKASRYVDVIAFNEYAAWYGDAGRTEVVGPAVAWVLKEWHKTFRKPVLVAEFGADAVAGLHQDPPVMWTEEYQVEVLREQTKAFDRLPFLIGEHVWNFADFMTAQGTGRVVGNRKGVFTRQRQPKAAAHFLRDRWTHLKRK